MQGGKLRDRIALKSLTSSTDSGGFVTSSESTIATVWASINELSGNELLKAGREVGTRYAMFLIRYRSDISQKTVIGYDSKNWDIESIKKVDLYKRRDHLEIFARAHD